MIYSTDAVRFSMRVMMVRIGGVGMGVVVVVVIAQARGRMFGPLVVGLVQMVVVVHLPVVHRGMLGRLGRRQVRRRGPRRILGVVLSLCEREPRAQDDRGKDPGEGPHVGKASTAFPCGPHFGSSWPHRDTLGP